MKRLLFFIIFFLAIVSIPPRVFAQPMPVLSGIEGMGRQPNTTSDDHTAREEAEGKEIWEKLQAKQITCSDLTNDNFGALGEYFMGQSIGNTERHAAMNQMMINMMGEEGEEQMHISLGKRSSGCDTSVQFPQGGIGFVPMMGGWGSFGILGWVSMLLFWFLIILGVIALIRYLGNSGKTANDDKTPLDILKVRYAKGEIDKKEFEGKKKDLS